MECCRARGRPWSCSTASGRGVDARVALRDAPPDTKRLMAPGPPSELEPRAGGVGERVDSSYYGSFFAGRQRVGRRLGFVPSVKLMAQMHFPGVRRRALHRGAPSRQAGAAGPCVQLRLRSPPKPLRRVRHDQRLLLRLQHDGAQDDPLHAPGAATVADGARAVAHGARVVPEESSQPFKKTSAAAAAPPSISSGSSDWSRGR